MGVLDDAIREHLDLKRARGADPTEIERLEREALGPVRRERGMGVSQYDGPEQQAPASGTVDAPTEYHESARPDGGHEQTAPHLNLAGAHAEAKGFPVDEEEAPRRRGFLRRSRGVAPAKPEEITPDVDPQEHVVPEHHEERDYVEGSVHFEPAHDEPLHEDPLLYDRPVHRDEPVHHDEPLPPAEARPAAEPVQYVAPEPVEELQDSPHPPPLAFDAPPPRPRFTPEPPTTIQTANVEDEPAEPLEESAPRRAEPAPKPAEHHDEPQPTREFDALGETAPEADDEEDVLEETPEFLQDTPEHDRLWFEQRPPRDFDFDG